MKLTRIYANEAKRDKILNGMPRASLIPSPLESTELALTEVKDGIFCKNKGISHGRQRFYFSGDGS